jgi:hypothetical protein
MRIFPFLALPLLAYAILIPITTGTQRCMVIYSVNQEDTIKITIKTPQDPIIATFYDYIAQIRDLAGNTIATNYITQSVFRTEIIVPNCTSLLN